MYFLWFLAVLNFFLLHPHENQSKVFGYQGWDKILMTNLISSQKSPAPSVSALRVYVLSKICSSKIKILYSPKNTKTYPVGS